MGHIKQFEAYLEIIGCRDVREVSKETILKYQEKIVSEKITDGSKGEKLNTVKKLFEYLIDCGSLLINPAENLKRIKHKNRKIGISLDIDEIKRLLSAPNLSKRLEIRDRAIMEVMYSSGIRINELIHLEVYDVDLKEKVLHIRKGKGGKQRVTPLGKEAVKYVKEYLEKIRPCYARKNSKERKLFLKNTGLAITNNCVTNFLSKYRIKAKIKKHVSPHVLRRSCATHFLNGGADIRYVQKLLGHRSLRTTQRYTKIVPIDIKKTHEKSHPGVL
ncbi:MAG: tyrosine-type recombinase/integrase [Desulfobacterales bacterium]|nr:tyrosine-type recombinase/integrase [Desulfobacterales bacterium]